MESGLQVVIRASTTPITELVRTGPTAIDLRSEGFTATANYLDVQKIIDRHYTMEPIFNGQDGSWR